MVVSPCFYAPSYTEQRFAFNFKIMTTCYQRISFSGKERWHCFWTVLEFSSKNIHLQWIC